MSRWAFFLMALLVPLGFVVAAFTGALGPAFRLDGTVDHVALVLVTVDVSSVPIESAPDASPMVPVQFGWCPQAQMEGNRLVWFGDNFDPRTSVVILLRYTGDHGLGGHGGNEIFEQVEPGQEYAVRPALKGQPPLYRVQAQPIVTTAPVAAAPTGLDSFTATYNVTGSDPWVRPGGPGTNLTVTEVHTLVTGYGVPVVRQAAPICF